MVEFVYRAEMIQFALPRSVPRRYTSRHWMQTHERGRTRIDRANPAANGGALPGGNAEGWRTGRGQVPRDGGASAGGKGTRARLHRAATSSGRRTGSPPA